MYTNNTVLGKPPRCIDQYVLEAGAEGDASGNPSRSIQADILDRSTMKSALFDSSAAYPLPTGIRSGSSIEETGTLLTVTMLPSSLERYALSLRIYQGVECSQTGILFRSTKLPRSYVSWERVIMASPP